MDASERPTNTEAKISFDWYDSDFLVTFVDLEVETSLDDMCVCILESGKQTTPCTDKTCSLYETEVCSSPFDIKFIKDPCDTDPPLPGGWVDAIETGAAYASELIDFHPIWDSKCTFDSLELKQDVDSTGSA